MRLLEICKWSSLCKEMIFLTTITQGRQAVFHIWILNQVLCILSYLQIKLLGKERLNLKISSLTLFGLRWQKKFRVPGRKVIFSLSSGMTTRSITKLKGCLKRETTSKMSLPKLKHDQWGRQMRVERGHIWVKGGQEHLQQRVG